MLEGCGIDKSNIVSAPVASVLSKSPAEAEENRRVEVWISVKGFGDISKN